jgi:hypothetical protein
MTDAEHLAGFLAPLAAVQRLLERFDHQGMIIGGIAALLLGRPRLTADIDVLVIIPDQALPELVAAAIQEGLTPRLADAEQFARRSRVLLLRHVESGVNVDIQLGMLPFEAEAIARSTIYRIGDTTLRLPTPEDLIVFKAVAHRPRDLSDIEALIHSHPNLDRDRVRRLVQAFALELDMSEIWDDIAGWL